MSYAVNNAPQFGAFSVTLTGGTSTAGGGVASIPNPEGVDLVVADAFLYVRSNSTGAANLTIGTAASGTAAATSMLPATAMAAAAGNVYALYNHGTAVGAAGTLWDADHYVNVAGSGSTVGLEAELYIKYYRTE